MYNKHICVDIENVENYEAAKADNFIGWDLHHKFETHNSDGERRKVNITHKELIALNMYYDRPPEELIFLTRAEHNMLHHQGNHYMLEKRHSSDVRKKISEGHKGKLFSEEHRKKLAKVAKTRNVGKHWYNNSKINKRCYECPEGFVPGMLSR